jgi:hypothetical protein
VIYSGDPSQPLEVETRPHPQPCGHVGAHLGRDFEPTRRTAALASQSHVTTIRLEDGGEYLVVVDHVGKDAQKSIDIFRRHALQCSESLDCPIEALVDEDPNSGWHQEDGSARTQRNQPPTGCQCVDHLVGQRNESIPDQNAVANLNSSHRDIVGSWML